MALENDGDNILVTCGNDIVSKDCILDSLKGLETIPLEMRKTIADQTMDLLTVPMAELEQYIPESERIVDFN